MMVENENQSNVYHNDISAIYYKSNQTKWKKKLQSKEKRHNNKTKKTQSKYDNVIYSQHVEYALTEKKVLHMNCIRWACIFF